MIEPYPGPETDASLVEKPVEVRLYATPDQIAAIRDVFGQEQAHAFVGYAVEVGPPAPKGTTPVTFSLRPIR